MDAAGERTSARALTKGATVLWILVLCYAVNFADRTIINTLGEAIKDDLRLSDLQLGLLGGLSFAMLYCVSGLVVARFADRYNRVNILAGAVAIWSLLTMLCGTAGNYLSLFLMRMGVGVGEAGCAPPAQSLISDYFPPNRRATAIAIYYTGVPLGVLGGAFAAGLLAEQIGWRMAFVVVGMPGLLLALLVWLVLREPPRGRFDGTPENTAAEAETPSFWAVVGAIWSTPGLRHIAAGTTLSAFASYSISQFLHPLFVRGFDMSYANAALIYGLLGALSAGLGSPLGGYLADKLSARDGRWMCWLPGIGLIMSAPFYFVGLFQENWMVLTALLFIPGITHNFYHGPTYAAVHNALPSRMRATSTAILIFLSAAIGLGLGPLSTGLVSDVFAQTNYTGAGNYNAACIGTVAGPVDTDVQIACREASSAGVRMALLIASSVFIWAGLHYFIAARALRRR